MMVPGLVTVFLFQFVAIWNNFLLPFIMLGDDQQFPVTVGLYTLLNQGANQPALYTLGDHRRAAVDHPADRAVPHPAAVLAGRPAAGAVKALSRWTTSALSVTSHAGPARQPPDDPRRGRARPGVSRGTVSRVLNGGH